MSDVTTVILLSTANVKGNLALLPRLATLIQRERRTAEGLVLLLDLGDTCSADVWVCRATLGRAPLLVLDAMGYDAALVGGPEKAPIPPGVLRRLRENMGMLTPIWGRPAQIVRRGLSFPLITGAVGLPAEPYAIRVDRMCSTLPDVGAPGVVLGDVPQGTVARVDLVWPEWTVQAVRRVSVEPDVPPDPSVTAVVELVESEARSLAEQQEDA